MQVHAKGCFINIECREKQNRKMRMKLEDEQAELDDIKRQLEEEQAQEKAAKTRLAAEQAQLRKENDDRIAAKHAARAAENAEDARLLEETIKSLEKKDKDRQQALKDFHVRLHLLAQPDTHGDRRSAGILSPHNRCTWMETGTVCRI